MPTPTDNSSFVPQSDSGFLNSLTGLLSKAADTAIDVVGLKAIGSVYPTGQVNPATVASQNTAANQSASATASIPAAYKPYLIGGGIFVGVLLLAVVLTRRK
jgi:hypothetical protein